MPRKCWIIKESPFHCKVLLEAFVKLIFFLGIKFVLISQKEYIWFIIIFQSTECIKCWVCCFQSVVLIRSVFDLFLLTRRESPPRCQNQNVLKFHCCSSRLNWIRNDGEKVEISVQLTSQLHSIGGVESPVLSFRFDLDNLLLAGGHAAADHEEDAGRAGDQSNIDETPVTVTLSAQ